MEVLNIFNFVMLLGIGILYIFMPNLMNKYLLFGVTVDDFILDKAETDDIKKNYKNRMIFLTILVLVIYGVIYVLSENMLVYTFIGLLTLELIGMSYVYLLAHWSMKKVKGEVPEQESQLVSTELGEVTEIKVLSYYWYLVYFVIVIGIVVFTLSIYDSLPNEIAAHYDANGNVDRYVTKSYGYVLMMPIVMVFMSLLFVGINYSLKSAKKVSGVSRGKLSIEQEKRYRYSWSIGTFFLGLIVVLLFAVVHLFTIEVFEYTENIFLITMLSVIPIMAIVVVLAVKYGQSGSKVDSPEQNKEIIDKDDDEFWRLGVFYVNKKDPTLFVSKRFGVGLTLNFGNPIAWVIIAIIILIVVASVVLPFVLA